MAKNSVRFACFTKEQQKEFDKLNPMQQKYVVYRAQGQKKVDAYISAGYAKKGASQGACILENRNPQMQGLIGAMTGHFERERIYQEGTPESNKVDKKAKGLTKEHQIVPAQMPKVPTNSGIMEQRLPSLENIGAEEAQRIQFYRQIANGTLKTTRETKTYDKDGNLTGRKVEETSDIDTRIKARKELDRVLGINDMLTIGSVDIGEMKITIVDASRKSIEDNERMAITPADVVEVDGEQVIRVKDNG